MGRKNSEVFKSLGLFMQLGCSVAIPIVAGTFIGNFLGDKYGNSVFLLIGMLVGLALGLLSGYMLIKNVVFGGKK